MAGIATPARPQAVERFVDPTGGVLVRSQEHRIAGQIVAALAGFEILMERKQPLKLGPVLVGTDHLGPQRLGLAKPPIDLHAEENQGSGNRDAREESPPQE